MGYPVRVTSFDYDPSGTPSHTGIPLAAALLLSGLAGCSAPPAGPDGTLLPTSGSGPPGEPSMGSGDRIGLTLPPDLPPSAVAALGTWYLDDDGRPATLRIGCS